MVLALAVAAGLWVGAAAIALGALQQRILAEAPAASTASASPR
jgi:hypothetical protein